MRIPYVIDNQTHKMLDILNGLLSEHRKRSLSVGIVALGPQSLRTPEPSAAPEDTDIRPWPL